MKSLTVKAVGAHRGNCEIGREARILAQAANQHKHSFAVPMLDILI